MDALEIVKTVIGGSFVLFIPGFAWSYLFFKQNEIDWIERIAISFGLSIALVPLVMFWLYYVFRIGLNFVNVTVVILVLILIPVIKMRYGDRIEDIWKRRK
ncbi:MAG TPA: DUF1616 domain-containing protein [Archaeoglobaceae archaeon]|nr:DUF1616 domain-containing protein [Archaeoglobaceae archaeon]